MHFMSDYFTFDSKIFKSYFPLIFKPGFLTIEYLQGKRTKYIPPLRMYIFVSIVLFIIWQLGVVEKSTFSISSGIENIEWDKFFNNYMAKIFFFLLPFFAIILRLFYKKTSGKFLIDFVFSIHYHSFIFLTLLFYAIISPFIRKIELFWLNKSLLILMLVYAFYYLWKALYEVYGDGKFKTFFKQLGILSLYFLVFSLSTLAVLFIMIM